MGKAVGKDGFSVVVAQYSPPGNIDGIVKENVGKLCSPGKFGGLPRTSCHFQRKNYSIE